MISKKYNIIVSIRSHRQKKVYVHQKLGFRYTVKNLYG